MRTRMYAVALFLLASSTGAAAGPPTTSAKRSPTFEPNAGQTDPRVRFVSRNPRFTFFLTDDALVVSLAGATHRTSSVRIAFDGARQSPRIEGTGPVAGAANYFRGQDPAAWHAGVDGFTSVRYTGLYRGIDLLVYARARQVEYDFIVAPRANPSAIRLRVDDGATSIDASGNVRIDTPSGPVTLSRPVIYQEGSEGRHTIDGHYVRLSNGDVGLRVGHYDRSRALVIDPVLAYSTYLGGSDWDVASDLQVDAAGNAYVCGYTASLNFPTTTGQMASGGSFDAFVAKLTPDGTLAWSTYLGGSGFENCEHLAIDRDGFIYAVGGTTSSNFPVVDAFQPTLHGSVNGFITKLDPSGSQIVYSTYLGGSGADDIHAIAVDGSGAAYVTGAATSTDFPLVNPVQPQFGGGFFDVFVAKVTPAGDAVQFSTYMGGSDADSPEAIAVGPGGEVWVAGATPSTDFPLVRPLQPQNHGLQEGFVFTLSGDGSTVLYSTYLGTTWFDSVNSLKPLDDGTVLVAGSAGAGLSTTPGVFGPFFHDNGTDAFVGRLSADGQRYVFLTYFGGNDGATRVDVDPAGHVWVAGSVDSTDLPTRDPLQASNGDGGCCQDAFVAELSSDATELLFSTYLGGSDIDSGTGLGVDGLGNVSLAGQTLSLDFPTVNPVIAAESGPRDAFVARIVVNHAPAADAGPDITVNGDATCHANVTVDGSASSDPDGDPLTYSWSGAFGTTSGVKPTISAAVGTQPVALTVSDGDGGTASDSMQITVINTVPPSIDQLTATPSELDPPDHRMVAVSVATAVTPACGTTATCEIVSVSSNESQNAAGDGNTSPDWVITGPLTLQLRAERSGSGSGRVYTITVRCTDSAGNSSTKTVTVTVS